MTRNKLIIPLCASVDARERVEATRANELPPPTPGRLTPDTLASDSFRMADAISMLTKGCLVQSTLGTLEVDQPIVQCVQVRPMNNQNGVERWRVVMSDSVNFMQGMLGQRE